MKIFDHVMLPRYMQCSDFISQGPCTSVTFSKSGEYFASGGSDEQVSVCLSVCQVSILYEILSVDLHVICMETSYTSFTFTFSMLWEMRFLLKLRAINVQVFDMN
jgi:hypothetical protein